MDKLKVKVAHVKTKMNNLTWTDVAVPVVFTIFVIMRAFDRVVNKRIADILSLPAYNNVYSNIVFPIGGLVGQGLLSIGYIYFMRKYQKNEKYDWKFYLPNWQYASNAGSFWQVPLMIMALIQNLGNLSNSLAAPFLSQNMQSILQNLNIPFCMVGAIFFLNTRFFANHYLACLTIIMAAFVSLSVALTPDAKLCQYQVNITTYPILPDILADYEATVGSPFSNETQGEFFCQTGSSLNTYMDASGKLQPTSSAWYLVFIFSVMIQAASNVYQQYILQGPDLEIMWCSFWTCVWQVPFGLLLLLTMTIETTVPGVPVNMIGEAIGEGLGCFFGTVPNTTLPGVTQDDVQVCAGSGGATAFQWFIIYSLFNISFNVLLMWLTKYLSTTWAQIATILCLDIAGLLSMSPALQGGSASFPTISEWMGYILAAIGLFVYNLQDEVDRTTGETKCLIHQDKEDNGSEDGDDLARVGIETPEMNDPSKLV